MSFDLIATETVWYIAHNGGSIIHPGIAYEGCQVTTGQPYFETFNNETDWLVRLTELGYQPEN